MTVTVTLPETGTLTGIVGVLVMEALMVVARGTLEFVAVVTLRLAACVALCEDNDVYVVVVVFPCLVRLTGVRLVVLELG